MIVRIGNLSSYRGVLAWSVAALLLGCAVQLAAPYDEGIDKEAQALKTDFLRFVANRQSTAGTPQGYYRQFQGTYTDFAARLGAVELRSEDQPGGVSCDRALEIAKKVGTGLSLLNPGTIAHDVSASHAAGASCTTILIQIAERQMERLRSQDELRCTEGAPPARCSTLFGRPPIYNIVASVHVSADTAAARLEENGSPLVSAVLISIDELEGLEQDMKPASKG